MNEPTGFSTDPLENLTDWANRLRQTDIALGIAEALTEYANAWQAERERKPRWVKCSERMPPKPGQYFILEKIHTTAGLRLAVALGKTEGWITHDRDDVVAWLENVPEFVP